MEEAEYQLKQLANLNKLGEKEAWGFHEWVDWDGKPRGQSLQSWSAGTYIMAYHAVKKKEKVWNI